MAGDEPIKMPTMVSPPPPPPKTFECPSCGSPVSVRAVGLTVSVVCKACHSIINATNENYQIISKAINALKVEPLIPIGQRGKFRGILWEVIGFMERSDATEVYTWREYLLFNPFEGFRWLTEFDGHWNYVVMVKQKVLAEGVQGFVENGRTYVAYAGRQFYLFNQGKAIVQFVVGEFYWRVKYGETVDVNDYVSPPLVLSSEKSPDETVWSTGTYVEASEIRAAFDIKRPMPYQRGVAPNQSSTLIERFSEVEKYCGFLLIVVVVIQILSVMRAHNSEVFQQGFNYVPSDVEKTKVTSPFQLEGDDSNVEFDFSAPVDNNWFEANLTLVNDQTGQDYEFDQGVEFYSGYDDGYWSEGSRLNRHVLSGVPAGTYHLNVEPSAPPAGMAGSGPGVSEYSIRVIRDVTVWSNFFWALGLILFYPAWVWLRRRNFEADRWSTSDFSPYWSLTEMITNSGEES